MPCNAFPPSGQAKSCVTLSLGKINANRKDAELHAVRLRRNEGPSLQDGL